MNKETMRIFDDKNIVNKKINIKQFDNFRKKENATEKVIIGLKGNHWKAEVAAVKIMVNSNEFQ